jgi:hypothetical protein
MEKPSVAFNFLFQQTRKDARKALGGVGLLKKLEAVRAFLRKDVAVSARQNDGHVRVLKANLLGKFDAGHPGHDDVGENRAEGAWAIR